MEENKAENVFFIGCTGAKDLIIPTLRKLGNNTGVPYRGNNLIFRVFREIWFRLNLPFESIWYKKHKHIKEDNIIIFDSLIREKYLLWLKKHYSNKRIILLYVNPVKNTLFPTQSIKEVCDVYTSDYNDSKEYGCNYTPGFYFKEFAQHPEKEEYDVFYIGRDKGRLEELVSIEDKLKSQGLKTLFYITAPRRFMFWKHNKKYRPLIDYEDVLKYVSKSKAILMLSKGAQAGMTLRVYESIMNKKKLIIDNDIILGNEFYHKDNVFILNGNNYDELNNFLKKDWHEWPNEKIEKYYFENWIKDITK